MGIRGGWVACLMRSLYSLICALYSLESLVHRSRAGVTAGVSGAGGTWQLNSCLQLLRGGQCWPQPGACLLLAASA